ncbi:putative triglyceride lipase [Actinidia rufa]|uniref:Putative triglyceride lipase n=1 Tax=Actinidia rufa TaxID=165716 RepID=A0A7J0E527_9ERIC|nr:putative triglyceride lipase [Actinidia rufa]
MGYCHVAQPVYLAPGDLKIAMLKAFEGGPFGEPDLLWYCNDLRGIWLDCWTVECLDLISHRVFLGMGCLLLWKGHGKYGAFGRWLPR